MLKPIRLSLLGLFSMILVACVANPSIENGNGYMDSAVVTKQIKTKLVDQLGAQGFSIRVKVYRDEILLSGFVENQAARQKAGEIAASVGNAKLVRNDLMVK